MSIVEAVLKARQEMEALSPDKKAAITGSRGSYSFKYTSLTGMLDVVVPALAKQGVLLQQDVYGNEEEVCVITILLLGEEKLESRPLRWHVSGSTQDLGKAITSLCRYQLARFLSLTEEEDEPQPTPAVVQQKPTPAPAAKPAAGLDVLRNSARKGGSIGALAVAPDTIALALRVRKSDAEDSEEMSTEVAEGKKISMYTYMMDIIESIVGKGNGVTVLSFLFGRVVSQEFPPKVNTKWLFDEVAAGQHKVALGEARKMVSA